MATIKTFSYNGVDIAYRDEGSGHPIVALSGWGYGSLMSEAAFGKLRQKKNRLITIDVPGTGKLASKSSFVHIPRLSKTIAAFMREENLNESTIIGHSFGSMIAQEMAISEDDVVAKLVLISTLPGIGGVTPDLDTSMEMLNRLLSGNEELFSALFTPGYLSQLQSTLGDIFDDLHKPNSSTALSGQVWAASRWSNFGRLKQIYQPVLVIHGTHDPLSPLAGAQMLVSQFPHGHMETIDCGYLPFLEKQEETLKVLQNFISS